MKRHLKKLRSAKIKRKIKLLSRHPFVVPVSTFVVLFFFSLVVFVIAGGQTIGASDTRVVQLHVDNQTQVVPTRAVTVKELLEKLAIEVKENDIVEPALDAEISDDNFQVNVYRARPVLVEDGGKKVLAMTAQPTPKAVAESVGIKVYPEDIIEKQPLDVIEPISAIKEGVVSERIVIDRATPVDLNIYGKLVRVRTHASTVGELLKEKNIELKGDDTLQPSAETKLGNETKVTVARFGTQLETVEEEIPMPIEYIDDPNLARGIENVRESGSLGKKTVTYEIILTNGQETARNIVQEVIVSQPATQVVIRGTKLVISNPSANVALGQQIAAEMGWGHEFSCIYDIFQRESGWNHLAQNRSSGAYGIPQALPGTKMGPGWQSDPNVQIRWGIGYMVNRYGSPCGAQAFWQVNHWY